MGVGGWGGGGIRTVYRWKFPGKFGQKNGFPGEY